MTALVGNQRFQVRQDFLENTTSFFGGLMFNVMTEESSRYVVRNSNIYLRFIEAFAGRIFHRVNILSCNFFFRVTIRQLPSGSHFLKHCFNVCSEVCNFSENNSVSDDHIIELRNALKLSFQQSDLGSNVGCFGSVSIPAFCSVSDLGAPVFRKRCFALKPANCVEPDEVEVFVDLKQQAVKHAVNPLVCLCLFLDAIIYRKSVRQNNRQCRSNDSYGATRCLYPRRPIIRVGIYKNHYERSCEAEEQDKNNKKQVDICDCVGLSIHRNIIRLFSIAPFHEVTRSRYVYGGR